ncbi:reverse transcriptase domain-containing protein [Tanacetum coccineum]
MRSQEEFWDEDGRRKTCLRSDKLDDALWAFRTAYKTPIGCTPYKLVYGKACHLPVELELRAYWASQHATFDLKDRGRSSNAATQYKDPNLHVVIHVLLFNSRLKIFSGKLKSRWSGPFTITEVYPYGTAKLSHADGSIQSQCHVEALLWRGFYLIDYPDL